MAHSWIPSTEKRILRPLLEELDPEARVEVEADLAKLLENPDDPGFFWTWWRGRPESLALSKTRLGILAGRVALRYIVFRDQPYIAVVNAVDLGGMVEVT